MMGLSVSGIILSGNWISLFSLAQFHSYYTSHHVIWLHRVIGLQGHDGLITVIHYYLLLVHTYLGHIDASFKLPPSILPPDPATSPMDGLYPCHDPLPCCNGRHCQYRRSQLTDTEPITLTRNDIGNSHVVNVLIPDIKGLCLTFPLIGFNKRYKNLCIKLL